MYSKLSHCVNRKQYRRNLSNRTKYPKKPLIEHWKSLNNFLKYPKKIKYCGNIVLPANIIIIKTSDGYYDFINDKIIKRYIGENIQDYLEENKLLELPTYGKQSLNIIINFLKSGKMDKSSKIELNESVIKRISHIQTTYDSSVFTILMYLGVDIMTMDKNWHKYRTIYGNDNVTYEEIIKSLREISLYRILFGLVNVEKIRSNPSHVLYSIQCEIIIRYFNILANIISNIIMDIENKYLDNPIKYRTNNHNIDNNINNTIELLESYEQSKLSNIFKNIKSNITYNIETNITCFNTKYTNIILECPKEIIYENKLYTFCLEDYIDNSIIKRLPSLKLNNLNPLIVSTSIYCIQISNKHY